MQPTDCRCEGLKSGYVSLVGRPNVGKSTLFNALVGERLSIVTRKPQTTRDAVLGILNRPGAQMLFLDTPGLLDPAYRLQAYMAGQVRAALSDADVVLVVVDASDLETSCDRGVSDALAEVEAPRIVAVNKTDLVIPDALDRVLAQAAGRIACHAALPISADRGCGLESLLQAIAEVLPTGPRLYPEETLTDQPERFFVSELVREAIFTQLRQELPYATAVRIEEYKEDRSKIYIRATVIVERESQKGIVIGGRGRTLRAIGKAARASIEAFLEQPVYLDLHVKVQENWRKKDAALKRLGYR
jgi:GTP-binding protein Era